MTNHRCIRQKSLIPIRKWLLEAGDGPSTPVCIPSSKLHRTTHQKSYFNKINTRKKFNYQNFDSKTSSIIDWLYEFIKDIFTIYDKDQFKSDNEIYNCSKDDITISSTTCSTCQYENIDPSMNIIQPTFESTTAISDSNQNKLQSIVHQSSKFTQTQLNHNEQQSAVYPLYCFSVKDGQILPLMLLSFQSSTNPRTKQSDPHINSPTEEITIDNHPYSPNHPTISSTISSNSNIISLERTQNLTNPRSSLSLHDTHICHFDKRNCLIECYHSSDMENKHRSKFYDSSNIHTNSPEIVFAEVHVN